MDQDQLNLQRIDEALEKIELYTRQGRDLFLSDPMAQDAVVRNLEIVGALTERLSEEVRSDVLKASGAIVGFCVAVSENCLVIDSDQIWSIAHRDVPALRLAVERFLRRYQDAERSERERQQREREARERASRERAAHEVRSARVEEPVATTVEAASPEPRGGRMHIVMITPEIAPAAKVGGLADVVVGLSRELMKKGHLVEVICPKYSCMRYDLIEDLQEVWQELWVPHYEQWQKEKVFKGTVSGIPTYFITGGNYTDRRTIYGHDDDLFRFTYFTRAALEYLYKSEKRPDILHCHDWATALVPVMYFDLYQPLGWTNSRVTFTIHNTECQGLCWYGQKLFGMVQMDSGRYHQADKMRDDYKPNCTNLMRGGIVYSNFVTTVSPTFAGEIKRPESGRGLQNVLNLYSSKVGGVINGIDYDVWNPATDPHIAHNYTVDSYVDKYKNKYALREWLHLADAWKPIVSVVTRLTHQKGLDLIKHAIYSTLRMNGQFVLLGESPDPRVNADFWRIKNELAQCPDVHLWIGYHEDLAHLIYAGSDAFLVPSLYEPCGLTQLIALRYGTVPIVRATGGLADTVFDAETSGRGLANSNGFVFQDASTAALDGALGRALGSWYETPDNFNKLAKNGMRFDYSWKHPAQDYENIYNFIRAK